MPSYPEEVLLFREPIIPINSASVTGTTAITGSKQNGVLLRERQGKYITVNLCHHRIKSLIH